MSLSSQFQKLDTSAKSWHQLFNKLNAESSALMKKNKLTFEQAFTRDNCEKNRYTNVLPYDQNRVILKAPNVDGGTYVNASPVNVAKAHRNYILSQGPVVESLSDFWQMIFENEVPAIIMLNRLYEGNSLKCEKYYPTADEEEPLTFGDYTIEVVKETQQDQFIVRELRVRNASGTEWREVIQVQYTEWPDFGVPESPGHFLEMLDCIKGLNVLSSTSEEAPVVVHCSAGIGRSGTFVLVDSVLRMVELGIAETEVDVNALLVELRSQRMGLIQTPEQLRFAWAAIVDGLEKLHQAVEAGGDSVSAAVNGDSAAVRNGKRKSESQEELNNRVTKRVRQLV